MTHPSKVSPVTAHAMSPTEAVPTASAPWHGLRCALIAAGCIALLAGVVVAARLAQLPAITPPWSNMVGLRAAAVERAEDALRESHNLLAAVEDAETGQRGFLLTSDESYLAPYWSGVARAQQDLRLLHALTEEDPAQKENLAELERLVDSKLTELQRTVKLARTGQLDAALAMLRSGSGRALMDDIRSTDAALSGEERRLLEERRRAAEEAELSARRGYVLSFAAALFVVLLNGVGIGTLLMRRVRSAGLAALQQDRERIEAAARAGMAERRRLVAALDLAATMVRTVDGTIQVWSAGCCKLFGYTADEAIGRRSDELLQTELLIPRADIEAALARDGEWSGELIQRRRDGSSVWVSSHWVLQRDEQGQPLAIMENSTDATDLVHAREALAASEAEFRASFEQVAVGKIEVDAVSLKILRVNQAFARMLGYDDPKHLIGLVPLDLTLPEDRPATMAAYTRLMAGEIESYTVERRHMRRDGTLVWTRACAAALRHPGEQAPSRLITTVEDIDAVYKAEQALRASEAQARFVVDATGMGMYELDVTRLMLRYNARASYICGDVLPPDRWVALDSPEYAGFIERMHPEDRPIREAALAALLDGSEDTNVVELRIQRPDGSWGWSFHQRAVVERDRVTGRPLRILGMVSDISDRARAEALLRENEAWLRDFKDELEQVLRERTAELAASEARFRAIFDSQFQFTGLLLPDGTLLEANKTTIEVSGVKREDVVGRPFWEAAWWLEADRELIRHAISRAATGEFVRREMEVVTGGGRLLWIDFSLTPVRNADGAIEFIIPEGRDRTEYRALQAQLARAQKLEAVGQLTAGVAHDFNNLLTVVSGNAERLRVAAERAGDHRSVRQTQAIERAAERGGRLASQLLAFSRKQVLNPELVVVSDLLTGMDDLLRRAVNETIRVEIRADPELWPCLIDAAQLESAVLNLVLNARDAMPENGGRIVIETSNFSFAGDQIGLDLALGDYVRLDVADSGSGMTPEVLAHAFEPFFTTKEIGRGSGLGLAQVHGFVGQSGGAVDITSEVGRGTTVSLFLPRATAVAPSEREAAAARSVAHGAGRSVLVVEDEPDLRESVGDILEDAGYRVLMASDADGARRILATERRVDLLFTDVVLPGGTSGVQLAHEVREREPQARVLLTSGYTGDDLERHAQESDAFGILRKPYAVPALLRKVREMFAAA